MAIDRNIARILISGRRDPTGHARHDDGIREQRRYRRDPWLNREQIGVATAVQRQSGHLIARDDLPKMGGGGLDLNACLRRHGHRVRSIADSERSIDADLSVGVHIQISSTLWSETIDRDGEIVVSHRKVGEGIEPLGILDRVLDDLLGGIYQRESRSRNDGTTWIEDCSRDASTGRCRHMSTVCDTKGKSESDRDLPKG